ncbi:hypothetical protein GCM10027051_35810 [Niabella terrae]
MSNSANLSFKKTPLYLLLILLGMLLAYIIGLAGINRDPVIKVENSAELIDDSLARAFVMAYAEDQRKLPEADRLVAAAAPQEGLQGFWVTKATLEELDNAIKKNNVKAKIVGYSLLLGKADPGLNKRAYNLVIRGSLLKEDEAAGSGTAQKLLRIENYQDSEEAIEMVDPIIN